MRRREFLLTASGAAGATAAGSGAVAAQETTETPGGDGGGTENGEGGDEPAEGEEGEGGSEGDGGGGGGTETVELVDYAFEPGTEEPLYVTPGTEVNFVWETDTHNIIVESQPEGANWEGYETTENAGFEYSHTFEEEGDYEFYCGPHENLGMVGTIVVNQEGAPPGGEGGGEAEPEEMGVPIQAHFVGTATLIAIFISLVFTFFFLKYGETPHSGYPEEK